MSPIDRQVVAVVARSTEPRPSGDIEAEAARRGVRPGAARQSLRRLASKGHIDRLAYGHRGRYEVRDRLFRRYLELQAWDVALTTSRRVANRRNRAVPPNRATGERTASSSRREIRAVPSAGRGVATESIGHSVRRGTRHAQGQQLSREQNTVVLALARLVREAIEADEAVDTGEPGPRRRIPGPAHDHRVAQRLFDATDTAA